MAYLRGHKPKTDPSCSQSDTPVIIDAMSWRMRVSRISKSQTCEERPDVDTIYQSALSMLGERHAFDLMLGPKLSPFRIKPRDIMIAIPYGVMSTYGAIAKECGANPIPIIGPNHRLDAANRRLGGFLYGGGTPNTKRLLNNGLIQAP